MIILPTLQCQKLPVGYPQDSKTVFLHLKTSKIRKSKKTDFFLFRKKFYSAEKGALNSQNYFVFQAETSYESERSTL